MTAPRVSEDDLLDAVLDLAKTLGLRTAHFRPAQTAQGWRTPVSGDGKGWPDLVLVGPGGVLFRELKSARGAASVEQRLWLNVLALAGQDTGVWRPDDLQSGRILAEMQALRATRAVTR